MSKIKNGGLDGSGHFKQQQFGVEGVNSIILCSLQTSGHKNFAQVYFIG